MNKITQSRLGSLIESACNIIIVYTVALASQLLIYSMFGINVGLSTNMQIGLWFTVIILIRSYAIRRWFNARMHAAASAMARKMAG